VEKRKSKRHPKRFKVRFGEKGFTQTGFTADVSASGLFVAVSPSPRLGTRLHFELFIDAERSLFFEGIVQRLVAIPPQLREIIKPGFGVRILTGGELLLEMVPQPRDKARLRIDYDSPASFLHAYETELRRGGLFLRADRSYPIDSVVPLDLELAFAGRTVELSMRVVHVSPEPSGKHGVSLMFVDPPTALAELAGLVPR
jgi:Tfp pilus assembly protein PilZ